MNKIREQESDEVSEDLSDGDTSSYDFETDPDIASANSNSEKLRTSRQASEVRQPRRKILYNGPVILGQFNNWQPQPLIKVQRLARILDKSNAPDFLQQCKDERKCQPHITNVSQMKPNARLAYEAKIEAHERSYEDPVVWGPVIARYLQSNYRKTRLVGTENFLALNPKEIYVAGAYLDMGKHNYIVSNNGRTYFHQTTVGFRKEPVPVAIKGKKNAVVLERTADVFKPWQQDTPELLEKIYEKDLTYSKLHNFVKNPTDQQDIKDVILYHYGFIKDLFLTLAINSGSFPYVPFQVFIRFCRNCKIQDANLTQSRLSQVVEAAKPKAKPLDLQLPGQGPADLNRAEFTEALVRVAYSKFKEYALNKDTVTMRDAVDKLIVQKLKPHAQVAPWQIYRDEELWTREVNLVFYDNEEGLRKLYQKYCKHGINKVPYAAALRLLTHDCSIRLDKFDAMYCYSMSLSSCVDLYKATFNKLMHQSYEEFLEMIARAAELHFQDSDQESLALWEKVLRVLDEFFKLVEDCGVPVMPLWTEEEQDEESEPETPKLGLQRISMMKSDLYSSAVTGA